MARVVWKPGKVISVRLRNDVWVLAQMMLSPYLAFFDRFATGNAWGKLDLNQCPVLLYTPVARQLLQSAEIVTQKLVASSRLDPPKLWLATFPGSRRITLWGGTKDELELVEMSEKPGGKLFEEDITKPGRQERRVVKASVPLDDDATIDRYELKGIWTFPLLNERLYVCHLLRKNVDPLKDLAFDRPPRPEYKTFFDLMGRRADAAALGYET